MAKELTDIIKAAAVVRDETAAEQNTATRVGGVLTDLAQFVGEAVFAAGMTAKTSAAGVSLLIKYYDADGQPYTKELPLPVASLQRAGVLTPAQLADLNTADHNETTERQASDAELLRRIQGKSTSSSAYSDPCINIGAFDHLYAEDGKTIIKRATLVVQEALETQLQGTMQEVKKYIGKMRGLIYGIPFEAWNFVHRWPNAQQSSIYVQVLHSNFPADAAGEIAGQDSHLHTLSRTVKVYLDADGNFDHSEVSPWRECSLQEADRNNLAALAYLGAFASMDAAGDKAATIPYAGNADFVLLRFRIGDKGGLILQNVNGASTEQYLFYNGKRYVRYVDFTSADRTAVKTVQAWKLDGAAYIFYDAAHRIIYQRNQWDENISGGGPSTLPLASASYAGLLSNTAFTHLSNFNIYEHSVPTTTSVRLVFTKPLTGETGIATLAAATSARAGVLTAALYNELKSATANIATHYEEIQSHLNAIYTADRNETTERQASDAELLRRIQGKSTSSSAYSDPCINIGAFDHLYAEDGKTIIKRATLVVQEALETQLQGTMQEVKKYIGKMRGLIYGIPFEAWNFVHRWPNAQQSSIYVQVLHSNFPADAAGEIAGQDSHLHTLSRTVKVYLDADGNFDHSEVSPWRECSLQEADRNNLAALAYLGAFASMDAAGDKAATIPYAGNADFVLLRFRIGDKGGLILQNVNGASTEQYLFYNGKRYVRYVDFTSADRTAVKTVQAWKLDGAAYIFYDAANRIIYQRNQWDENISGGGPSTLPLASASYAGLLSNTAFTHLTNFNIYEHSVPTAATVRLVFTKPLTGEAGIVTLAAATSARAGVLTAALYNELKNATANIAAHYQEIQSHLNAIYSRLSVIENKIEAYHPTSTQS